jgi:hypothetical protein
MNAQASGIDHIKEIPIYNNYLWQAQYDQDHKDLKEGVYRA